MDTLGIDIGTVSVKYVRCKGPAGKSVLTSQGDYPYKGGFEDLELILADIKAKEGSDLEIAVGVSSPDIIKKTFTIPILPKKEQRDAFNWAAAKLLPTSLEEMVYEYLILGQIEEKGIMKDEVLFVGASKGFINRVLSAFAQADLKPITLVTDIAFGYVYSLGEVGERSIAIIDLGGKQTGLYIANQKRLMFAREILTASESFSDALMSGSGLSFEEAEEFKRERGFDNELTEILRIPFERLAGEIQRTFSVYNQRYPDRPVTTVYVTGRGIKIPKFFEKLEETLVEEVNYLETTQSMEDKYIPAHALCMNLDELPNLLPEGARKREQERAYKRYIVIGSCFIAAVLALLSYSLWSQVRNTTVLANAERRTLNTMKTSLGSLGTATPAVFDAGDLSAMRREIPRKDITFVTLLKYLSSQIPQEVVLKSIEFGEGIIPEPTPQAGQRAPVAPPSVQTPRGPSSTLVQKPALDYYPLMLKGYIFGEPDNLELSLFSLVLSLRMSGFIDSVEVLGKERKEMKGKPLMEFSILARCAKHEP